MNKNEIAMVDILKKLRDEYGVVQIKAEFENEGSRQDELSRLKDVASAADLPILIKIGGVEAITDIYNALILGVTGIVAPMAETKFAVSKFTDGVEKFVAEDNAEEIEFAFNVETITACENFADMLTLKNLNVLSSITIGRVDLTASMGNDRAFANGPEMLEICTKVFKQARAAGLGCGLGGAVSPDATDFIKTLIDQDLVDRFETRKIVFDKSAIGTFDKGGIATAVQFELAWLKSKQRYYHRIRDEDAKRIEMIESRL